MKIIYIEKGIEMHEYLQANGLGIEYHSSFGWKPIDPNSDVAAINAAIAAFEIPVGSLTPRQFKRFFILSNLDEFALTNLDMLRPNHPVLYADVVSQLEGGKVYYWESTKHFMQQLMLIVPNVPEIDFEELKALWIAQTNHHIEI